MPFLLFNSANFDVDSLFEAEAFFVRGTDLRRHANLLCEHRLTQVEGKNQTGGGDLGGPVAQELLVSLHESAELAGHVSDLGRLLVIAVDAEDELVPLKEGHNGRKVDGKLEGADDLLLKLNQGLFSHKQTLGISEEANHNVE